MLATINMVQEPCHQFIMAPPCPLDGPVIYDDDVGNIELSFFFIFAVMAIGVLMQQTLIGSMRRTVCGQEDAREAAERISEKLEILAALEVKPLAMSRRAVARDMLVIVDFIMGETDYYCYEDPPAEEAVLRSIFTMRSEAFELRRGLS